MVKWDSADKSRKELAERLELRKQLEELYELRNIIDDLYEDANIAKESKESRKKSKYFKREEGKYNTSKLRREYTSIKDIFKSDTPSISPFGRPIDKSQQGKTIFATQSEEDTLFKRLRKIKRDADKIKDKSEREAYKTKELEDLNKYSASQMNKLERSISLRGKHLPLSTGTGTTHSVSNIDVHEHAENLNELIKMTGTTNVQGLDIHGDLAKYPDRILADKELEKFKETHDIKSIIPALANVGVRPMELSKLLTDVGSGFSFKEPERGKGGEGHYIVNIFESFAKNLGSSKASRHLNIGSDYNPAISSFIETSKLADTGDPDAIKKIAEFKDYVKTYMPAFRDARFSTDMLSGKYAEAVKLNEHLDPERAERSYLSENVRNRLKSKIAFSGLSSPEIQPFDKTAESGISILDSMFPEGRWKQDPAYFRSITGIADMEELESGSYPARFSFAKISPDIEDMIKNTVDPEQLNAFRTNPEIIDFMKNHIESARYLRDYENIGDIAPPNVLGKLESHPFKSIFKNYSRDKNEYKGKTNEEMGVIEDLFRERIEDLFMDLAVNVEGSTLPKRRGYLLDALSVVEEDIMLEMSKSGLLEGVSEAEAYSNVKNVINNVIGESEKFLNPEVAEKEFTLAYGSIAKGGRGFNVPRPVPQHAWNMGRQAGLSKSGQLTAFAKSLVSPNITKKNKEWMENNENLANDIIDWYNDDKSDKSFDGFIEFISDRKEQSIVSQTDFLEAYGNIDDSGISINRIISAIGAGDISRVRKVESLIGESPPSVGDIVSDSWFDDNDIDSSKLPDLPRLSPQTTDLVPTTEKEPEVERLNTWWDAVVKSGDRKEGHFDKAGGIEGGRGEKWFKDAEKYLDENERVPEYMQKFIDGSVSIPENVESVADIINREIFNELIPVMGKTPKDLIKLNTDLANVGMDLMEIPQYGKEQAKLPPGEEEATRKMKMADPDKYYEMDTDNVEESGDNLANAINDIAENIRSSFKFDYSILFPKKPYEVDPSDIFDPRRDMFNQEFHSDIARKYQQPSGKDKSGGQTILSAKQKIDRERSAIESISKANLSWNAPDPKLFRELRPTTELFQQGYQDPEKWGVMKLSIPEGLADDLTNSILESFDELVGGFERTLDPLEILTELNKSDFTNDVIFNVDREGKISYTAKDEEEGLSSQLMYEIDSYISQLQEPVKTGANLRGISAVGERKLGSPFNYATFAKGSTLFGEEDNITPEVLKEKLTELVAEKLYSRENEGELPTSTEQLEPYLQKAQYEVGKVFDVTDTPTEAAEEMAQEKHAEDTEKTVAKYDAWGKSIHNLQRKTVNLNMSMLGLGFSATAVFGTILSLVTKLTQSFSNLEQTIQGMAMALAFGGEAAKDLAGKMDMQGLIDGWKKMQGIQGMMQVGFLDIANRIFTPEIFSTIETAISQLIGTLSDPRFIELVQTLFVQMVEGIVQVANIVQTVVLPALNLLNDILGLIGTNIFTVLGIAALLGTILMPMFAIVNSFFQLAGVLVTIPTTYLKWNAILAQNRAALTQQIAQINLLKTALWGVAGAMGLFALYAGGKLFEGSFEGETEIKIGGTIDDSIGNISDKIKETKDTVTQMWSEGNITDAITEPFKVGFDVVLGALNDFGLQFLMMGQIAATLFSGTIKSALSRLGAWIAGSWVVGILKGISVGLLQFAGALLSGIGIVLGLIHVGFMDWIAEIGLALAVGADHWVTELSNNFLPALLDFMITAGKLATRAFLAVVTAGLSELVPLVFGKSGADLPTWLGDKSRSALEIKDYSDDRQARLAADQQEWNTKFKESRQAGTATQEAGAMGAPAGLWDDLYNWVYQFSAEGKAGIPSTVPQASYGISPQALAGAGVSDDQIVQVAGQQLEKLQELTEVEIAKQVLDDTRHNEILGRNDIITQAMQEANYNSAIAAENVAAQMQSDEAFNQEMRDRAATTLAMDEIGLQLSQQSFDAAMAYQEESKGLLGGMFDFMQLGNEQQLEVTASLENVVTATEGVKEDTTKIESNTGASLTELSRMVANGELSQIEFQNMVFEMTGLNTTLSMVEEGVSQYGLSLNDYARDTYQGVVDVEGILNNVLSENQAVSKALSGTLKVDANIVSSVTLPVNVKNWKDMPVPPAPKPIDHKYER